ncbi:hypothetical protein KMP13_08870 [Epibacterium ulvae]|uniref:hypothetical protein n=1 Tax=Epibacterium ulvae TaxID=1156985 RepID=UPI001BFC748C|nr:hypothetical protein [Epibacterium ulvae]MBT8154009.1 hypothetical protein [Epibacterium ulvae]
MSFEQKLAFAFGGAFALLIYFLIRLAVKYRRGDFDGVPPAGRQTEATSSINTIDVAAGTGCYGGGTPGCGGGD